MSAKASHCLINANVIDVESGSVKADCTVTVRDGEIAEITQHSAASKGFDVFDARGGFVIPGLIDCHCHAMQTSVDLAGQPMQSPQYVMAKAYKIVEAMLMRGFTTIRDLGGADFGFVRAINEGLVKGPRIMHCGKAISQTGGHGDFRPGGGYAGETSYWAPSISRLADGVPEIRKAARDEIRKGATFLKIMGGGGIASLTDRIDSDQFSIEEINAIVEEARMANIYVAAHAYCTNTVIRAIEAGVRTVEHCTQVSDEALTTIRDHDGFMVPTMIVLQALADEGAKGGLAPEVVQKIGSNVESGLGAIERAHRLGVSMAYGSDLLADAHSRQLDEFVMRADVVPAADLLRSATMIGAQLIRQEDRLGQIKAGYHADMLVLNRNPLEDIRILAQPDAHLKAIIKGGDFVLNRL